MKVMTTFILQHSLLLLLTFKLIKIVETLFLP